MTIVVVALPYSLYCLSSLRVFDQHSPQHVFSSDDDVDVRVDVATVVVGSKVRSTDLRQEEGAIAFAIATL